MLIKVLNTTTGIGTDLTIEDLKDLVDQMFNKARKELDGSGITDEIYALAMETMANSGSNIYGWLGDVPGVREWLGSKTYGQMKEYNYMIRNREWYDGFSMRKRDMRRNGLVNVPMFVNRLLQNHVDHKKEMIMDALLQGDVNLAYDNIAFFSNATGVRVNDNLLAGTGVTISALQTDIQSARSAMAQFVNDRGRLLRIYPDTVVCPIALENSFRQIMNSTADPTSSNSGVANVVGGYIKRIIVDPALDADDTNDWYFIASGASMKPIILQKEDSNNGAEFESLIDDKNYVSDGMLYYSVESIHNTGYGLPCTAVKIVNA